MERKTKSRPIPLEDIRYFECEGLVDDGAYHCYTDKLFHVPGQAWARAKRLAELCRRGKVSITKRSLYLCFTPALSDGVIQPTDYRDEVWQRYVMYGLPFSFNECDEASRVNRIWRASVETLCVIAPEQTKSIEEAAALVEASGDELAFPLAKAKAKTKHYLAELSYTMPTWPNMAHLLLTLTDLSSQAQSSCVLFESKLSWECGFLGGKVKFVDGNVVVSPQTSRWGKFYSKQNDVSSFVVAIEALLQGSASVFRKPYEAHDT